MLLQVLWRNALPECPRSGEINPQNQAFLPTAGYSCINLSQIQGFSDPQEVTFEGDEGYAEMSMQAEHGVDNDNMKSEGVHSHHYSHSSDEGLGPSIKDAESPDDTGALQTDIDAEADEDPDAEAEFDEQEIIVAEEASDTDYTPKSRSRKRQSTKMSSPAAVKRGKITKSTPKARSAFTCKSCTTGSFKTAAALAKHIASSHTRAFTCVFHFAGCTSTFSSKNEWKRHVSSQHLNLQAWVCELGQCGKAQTQAKNGSNIKEAEFNRKDLFTQHLRRMHAPFAVKRKNVKDNAWEERVKHYQTSCLKVRRQAPIRLGCPVTGCDAHFLGANCWDERMEHVAKHLEKAVQGGPKVEQSNDESLLAWALKERVIERVPGGELKLCGPGAWKDREDEDAEGEEE